MSRFFWLACLLLASCTKTIHQENHLINEKSAYLTESANDEIWWYPWGERPLKYSKEKDRLIFLSIGYASCFACEKMHKLVYSDKEAAKFLNENFVSIKVDREERPDLDAYFLNMQSLIMRFGAWPINMILTPDLKPVYATTLLDKKSFLKILETSAKAWKDERTKILQGTTNYEVQAAVQESNHPYFEKNMDLIKDFYARYTHRFDTAYGGKRTGNNFNTKFPVNDEMRLLLRYHLRTKDEQPRKMVEKTMATIVKSALLDQFQGGFHRYSTTRDWNSPNYEKILKDQASFIHGLIDIYQFKKEEIYHTALEKTVGFLLNDFQGPRGGFYSSIGAGLNGEEGALYTWNPDEIRKNLSSKDQKLFNEVYGFSGVQRKYKMRRSIKRKTTFTKPGIEEVEKKLIEVRNSRGTPLVDKKIVTADNAYLISALARLQRIWPSESFYQVIKKNLDFILTQHTTVQGKLLRRSIAGHTSYDAIVDDFAFLIDALIEFYQAGFEEKYLVLANEFQKKQNELFWNSGKGLFEYTRSPEKFLKEQFHFIDQTHPSAMSMSYWNLIRLSRYFSSIEYEEQAQKVIDSYPDLLKTDPLSYSHLLLALDFQLGKPQNFVMVGNQKECVELSKKGFDGVNPYILFSCHDRQKQIPVHSGKKKIQGKLTYYVCDTRSCQPPTTDYDQAVQYYFNRN